MDDALLGLLAHVLEGLPSEAPEVDGLRDLLAERLREDGGQERTAAARCLLALGPGEEDAEALEVLTESPPDRMTVPACIAARADLIGELLSGRGVLQDWGFLLTARYPEAVPVEAFTGALYDHKGHEALDPIADALAQVSGNEFGDAILDFYDRHLEKHGDHPEAVRWTAVGQQRRYLAILKAAYAETLARLQQIREDETTPDEQDVHHWLNLKRL